MPEQSNPYATCSWSPLGGYKALTPFGEIKMFEEGGHRAVEVMLLAVAACLNYYLVEYIKARNLPIIKVDVKCDAEMAQHPERVSTIVTRVKIEGPINARECRKMVTMCERACKVANTLKHPPKMEIIVEQEEEIPSGAVLKQHAVKRAP